MSSLAVTAKTASDLAPKMHLKCYKLGDGASPLFGELSGNFLMQKCFLLHRKITSVLLYSPLLGKFSRDPITN